jgi:hypothetical protein
MKTYVHLLLYLADFFLEWEMFLTKFVAKSNTHFMFNNFFPRKSCRLWDNVEKYGRTREATDDNTIRRMLFACCITKATDTHSKYVIPIGFLRQQWLRERASMLHIYVRFLCCLKRI